MPSKLLPVPAEGPVPNAVCTVYTPFEVFSSALYLLTPGPSPLGRCEVAYPAPQVLQLPQQT